MTQTSSGDVFFSYSRKDAFRVAPFEARLLDAGIPVWRDATRIRPLEKWMKRIAETITSSRLVVVFVTRNSVDSANVDREVAFALGHGIPILRVQLDDVEPSPGVAYATSGVEFVTAWQLSEEEAVIEVLEAVHANGISATGALGVPDAARPPTRRNRWAGTALVVLVLSAMVAWAVGWFVGDDGEGHASEPKVLGASTPKEAAAPVSPTTPGASEVLTWSVLPTDPRLKTLARSYGAIASCNLDAFLATFAEPMERFFKNPCPGTRCDRARVGREFAKRFQRCDARVTPLRYRLVDGQNEVRVWKRTNNTRTGDHFCTCDVYRMRQVDGEWQIAAVYNDPNDRDPTCTKDAAWCFGGAP